MCESNVHHLKYVCVCVERWRTVRMEIANTHTAHVSIYNRRNIAKRANTNNKNDLMHKLEEKKKQQIAEHMVPYASPLPV